MAIERIENMETNLSSYIQQISWSNLRKANRATLAPFQLALTDSDDSLFCKEIVRVMPGKRLVAFGTWAGKSVVAKLFFEPHHAMRHAKRDYEGIQALLENGVLTPPVFYQGTSHDKRIHVLIFERIEGAQSLDTIWQERSSIKELMPLMQALTIELATHHVLGILQQDLHFKNFLIRGRQIYTIDGGDVEVEDKPLSKQESINNLGLFFSQLGVGTNELQQALFQIYARSRSWIVTEHDITSLRSALRNFTKRRWEQYSKKIMRTCTAFVSHKTLRGLTIYDRDYESAELLACLKNPEIVFSASDTEILKAGRTTTVAKIRIDGKYFVIKRYNIKNSMHWLRRCLRATRAATGWRLAQWLRLVGIPTAKPVAFIEKRFLGLRGTSYLLMEYVDGVHAGDYFAAEGSDSANSIFTAHQIIFLFENLARLRITHGDLKMTNVLIAKQKPVLIDLDGMCVHSSFLGFKRAFQKEIKRFMENWRNVPIVYSMFEQLVEEMYKRLGIKG